MDWKSFKTSASAWTAKAGGVAKKWFEASKEYAEKTGAWSYEKLKDSKFALKDIDTYDILKEEKRYAIFCIRDGDLFTKFFLPILPVIFTKAWIESGSVRIVIEEGTEELRKALEIEKTPSVLVKMGDGTIKRITDDAEIRSFIKGFSFYDKKGDEADRASDEDNIPEEGDVLANLEAEEKAVEKTEETPAKPKRTKKPAAEKAE